MEKENARKLKGQIEYCLEHIPETRNSDLHLTIQIWKEFYPEKMRFLGERMAVEVRDLYDLPREDEIKRIRATIQNEEKRFPPTSWEVAKQRKWNEVEWQNLLGYGTMSGGVGSPIGSPVNPPQVPPESYPQDGIDPRQKKML